jgi:hypothetical protein
MEKTKQRHKSKEGEEAEEGLISDKRCETPRPTKA